MKRLLATIIIGLLAMFIAERARAQQTIFVPTCSGNATTDTAAFTALITALGTTNPSTIQVPHKTDSTKRCVVNDLTVPANQTLDFTNGEITIASGKVLTLNNTPIVPAGRHVFYGTGLVSFAALDAGYKLEVSPTWWGGRSGFTPISGATNASSAVITSANHGLTSGEIIGISGGSGNWAAATTSFTVTVLSANTFSIPLNTSAFGAVTGSLVWVFNSTPAINAAIASGAKNINGQGIWGLNSPILITLPFVHIDGHGPIGTLFFALKPDISTGSLPNALIVNETNGTNFMFTRARLVSILAYTGWGISAVEGASGGAEEALISGYFRDLWVDLSTTSSGFFTGGAIDSFFDTITFENNKVRFNLNLNSYNTFSNIIDFRNFDELIKSTTGFDVIVSNVQSDTARRGFLFDLTDVNGFQASNILYTGFDDQGAGFVGGLLTATNCSNVTVNGFTVTPLYHSISATSNAAAAIITSVGHGLTTGDVVFIKGGTGSWTPVNLSFVATALTANTFSIPLDTSGFGAVTGTLTWASTGVSGETKGIYSNASQISASNGIIESASATVDNYSVYLAGLGNDVSLDQVKISGARRQVAVAAGAGGRLAINHSILEKSAGEAMISLGAVSLDLTVQNSKVINASYGGAGVRVATNMITFESSGRVVFQNNPAVGRIDTTNSISTYLYNFTGAGQLVEGGNNIIGLGTIGENNGAQTVIYIGPNILGVANISVNGALTVQGALNYAADAGSTDDYAITLAPAATAYTVGMYIAFKANTANTTACTINVNGLGPKALKRGVATDPTSNFIKAGSIVIAIYDGTNFQILSPAAQ